jgi:hypothetical protein
VVKYIFPIINKKREEEERKRSERVPARIRIEPPPEHPPDRGGPNGGYNIIEIDTPCPDEDINVDYTIQYSV